MLPPYCLGVDYVIELENNAKLPILPMYTYNEKELRCEKKNV